MSLVLLARRFVFSGAAARSLQLPRASAAIFCQRDIVSRTIITKSGSNEICNSQAAKHPKENVSDNSRPPLVSNSLSVVGENAYSPPVPNEDYSDEDYYLDEDDSDEDEDYSDEDSELLKKFEEWRVKFKRIYKSPEEQERRFKIFKQTVAKVNAYNYLNKRGLKKKGEADFGLTEFADMTLQEIPATHLLPPRQKKSRYANCPWLVCSLPNGSAQSNENVLSPVVYEEDDDSQLMKMFEEWMAKFMRSYTGLEKEMRFKIFKKTVSRVNAFNEIQVLKAHDHEGSSICGYGLNLFADMTDIEKSAYTDACF